MNAKNNNIIVKNKNAARNYHLSDKYQAGLVLEGWEVKGLRNGKVDVKDSYVTLKNNEAWVIGLKIDPPPSLKNDQIDPTRSRKLLLNKRENPIAYQRFFDVTCGSSQPQIMPPKKAITMPPYIARN